MESGRWSGSRGNSWCSPSTAYSKQILKQYNVDSILYVDGEPDFSPLSHSTVQLGNMTENRYSHGVRKRIPLNDLTTAANLFTKFEDVG